MTKRTTEELIAHYESKADVAQARADAARLRAARKKDPNIARYETALAVAMEFYEVTEIPSEEPAWDEDRQFTSEILVWDLSQEIAMMVKRATEACK